MAWHDGQYPEVTSSTASDKFLTAQSGETMVTDLDKMQAAMNIQGSRVLFSDSTGSATPASTTPKLFFSYTLPAGTLSVDGWFVRIRAWGYTGTNTNDKSLLFTIGATNDSSGNNDMENQRWDIDVLFVRRAAGNQDIFLKYTTCTTITWGDDAEKTVIYNRVEEWTENLNSALNIELRGISQQDVITQASDIVYQGSIITLNA